MLTQVKIFNLRKKINHIDEYDSRTEDDSEHIHFGQPQAEEPREPSVGVEDDEPVASRTRSQTELVVARTRQSLGSDPGVSAFVDVNEKRP